MRKYIISIVAVLLSACSNVREVNVTVENWIDANREGEMVEISMDEVVRRLNLPDTAQIVVVNSDGEQVPYQITYDDKLIFPVSVSGNSTVSYTIKEGFPEMFSTRVSGGYYPEREDDLAWENEHCAFRAYGPAFQEKGYKAYGYDVWTKYKTTEPVLEERYANELNPAVNERIAELKDTDPAEAERLYKSISYHVDHGNGMDCYTVGPTLGGGASALLVGDTIVYPNCYATQEILDNGPLRFTVQLTYNPLVVEADSNVVETRVITLDSGSYLNKTEVYYNDLSRVQNVLTGIVLHEADGDVAADTKARYIAYVDPTDNSDGSNGKIFVGAAFPDKLKSAGVRLFPERERTEQRGGAFGHVVAVSEYQPGSTYTYYWGAAWSKGEIATYEQWKSYLENYATRLKNPLRVIIE
jgi:hypothetical protein